jgi:putative peptidoglycan lipid II flippase
MIFSGITIAFFTFLSRIFGLVRELFIASLFGAGSTADSVNVAFKLPNLFRRIFGEGALSTVFIPIFNEKMLQSRDAARNFTGEIFTLLLLTLVTLVILMQIFMPFLMFIIAPGFNEDKDKFDLTILLCRITMPYLIFISVTALFGGILNSVKKFAAFAFSPVILSIIVIVGTVILKKQLLSSVSISLSLLIAGCAQVIFMFYCIAKAGLTFPLIFKPSDKDVQKFLLNMGPATISSGTQQLNLFISQSIASFLPGAVSILSYADRIYQFPLSIIGVTFGTILLPELSKIYKINNFDQAARVLNKAIKAGLLLSMPAAFGIIALSQPIIHIIYERGAFTADDTIKTAQAISGFAIGLPAFVLIKILTPIFYANQDTKTPLKITIYSLATNTILNFILLVPLGTTGIALGSSAAAWYNVWLLSKYMQKYNGFSISPTIKLFFLKVLFSCVIMTLVILIIDYYYGVYFYSESLLLSILVLTTTIAAGVLIFLSMSLYLRLHKTLLLKNEN